MQRHLLKTLQHVLRSDLAYLSHRSSSVFERSPLALAFDTHRPMSSTETVEHPAKRQKMEHSDKVCRAF